MKYHFKIRREGKHWVARGVQVDMAPGIAFAYYLRTMRLSRGMTQKEAAKLLGMKNIYSYQRLESGKTANPELLTLVRIKKIFPEIDLDDVVG